jgi:hypothetical protein
MPILTYTSSNFPFTPNTKIFSADVDQCFTDIQTLLNTTKLDNTNIQTGGISALNLASDSVTTIKILDANVTAAKLAANAVTTAAITDANVTGAKLASGAALANIGSGNLTSTYLASNLNLPGDSVQENGKNLIVSSTNASTSLAVIRGWVLSTGTVRYGEGYSVVKTVTGGYTVTFSNAFASTPVVTTHGIFDGATVVVTTQTAPIGSTTSFGIRLADLSGNPIDSDWSFIAIGPR